MKAYKHVAENPSHVLADLSDRVGTSLVPVLEVRGSQFMPETYCTDLDVFMLFMNLVQKSNWDIISK
jgi:hypothetical protein